MRSLLALVLVTTCFPTSARALDNSMRSATLSADVFGRKEIQDPRLTSAQADGLPRYMISWNSPSIDGHFDLVIHPHEIFLCSGHDNPNPNYLYWFTPITDAQYRKIQTYLTAYKGSDLQPANSSFPPYSAFSFLQAKKESPLPKEWTDEARRRHREASFETLAQNTRLLIDQLNRPVGPAEEKVPYPPADFVQKKRLVRLRP